MARNIQKQAEIIPRSRIKRLQTTWAQAQNVFQLCEAISRAVSVVSKHLQKMFKKLVELDFAEPLELDPNP